MRVTKPTSELAPPDDRLSTPRGHARARAIVARARELPQGSRHTSHLVAATLLGNVVASHDLTKPDAERYAHQIGSALGLDLRNITRQTANGLRHGKRRPGDRPPEQHAATTAELAGWAEQVRVASTGPRAPRNPRDTRYTVDQYQRRRALGLTDTTAAPELWTGRVARNAAMLAETLRHLASGRRSTSLRCGLRTLAAATNGALSVGQTRRAIQWLEDTGHVTWAGGDVDPVTGQPRAGTLTLVTHPDTTPAAPRPAAPADHPLWATPSGSTTWLVWLELHTNPNSRIVDIAASLGVHRGTAYRHLMRLAEYGMALPDDDHQWALTTQGWDAGIAAVAADSTGATETATLRLERIDHDRRCFTERLGYRLIWRDTHRARRRAIQTGAPAPPKPRRRPT